MHEQVRTLVDGVRAGHRAAVSRAITLVESKKPAHRELARELLAELTPYAGNAVRVGISGVPGVGKSTSIEALGSNLTAAGHKVAVLAVDPSSVKTGGSVLGDKTRMAQLSVDPNAYIRPSPSGGTLGGVARATAQAMTVVEAAGYDVVLVETVGVGQSEVTVASMVDTFLFLTIARTGDQLQGIKKGILEIADVVGVNKADDGDQEIAAKAAARELAGALRLVRGTAGAPQVIEYSGLHNKRLDVIWHAIEQHRDALGAEGLKAKRAEQQLTFTWALVREELEERLQHSEGVRAVRDDIRAKVLSGEIQAPAAADLLLGAYDGTAVK